MIRLVTAFVVGLISLPLFGVLLAISGLLPSSAAADPPGWEAALGARALDASLQRRSAKLQNPVPSTDTAALARGLTLYRTNCAGCHGGAREASTWGTKGFYPRVPQFWQERVEVTPEQAYAAIHDGVRYSGMAAWRDNLSEREIWEVANFVSRVHQLPPEVVESARRPIEH